MLSHSSSSKSISEKLRECPAKKIGKKVLIETAINTIIGCLASSLGAKTLGFNQAEGAAMGAAGHAVFSACRSLISSIYHYCKNAEAELKQEPVKEASQESPLIAPPKSYSANVINLFKNQLRNQDMLDSHTLQPVDYAAIARGTFLNMAKYVSYGVIGNMLGYLLLKMTPEFAPLEAATTGATGAAELLAVCFFVAAVGYCAPYLSNKCVDGFDAFMDAICCDESARQSTRRSTP